MFTKTWKTEFKTLGLTFKTFNFSKEHWFILHKMSDNQNVTYSLACCGSIDIPVSFYQGMIMEKALKEYYAERDRNTRKSLRFKWARFKYLRRNK